MRRIGLFGGREEVGDWRCVAARKVGAELVGVL